MIYYLRNGIFHNFSSNCSTRQDMTGVIRLWRMLEEWKTQLIWGLCKDFLKMAKLWRKKMRGRKGWMLQVKQVIPSPLFAFLHGEWLGQVIWHGQKSFKIFLRVCVRKSWKFPFESHCDGLGCQLQEFVLSRGDTKESLKVNVTVGLLAMHLQSTFNSSQLEFKHKPTVRTEFR